MIDMNRVRIELNYGLWKIGFLGAKFKEFLFRLVHGKLYVNQILANFADVRPHCTMCVIKEKREMKILHIEEDSVVWRDRLNRLSHESVFNLFWDCVCVRTLIDSVGNWLAGTEGRTFIRSMFFGGMDDISTQNMRMCILIVHYIKYIIFECKIRNRIPTITHVRYEMGTLFSCIGNREDWREQREDVPELVYRMMEDVVP